MNYRIKAVEAVRYPILLVTFDDGLSGEYDLTDWIGRAPASEPLKDRDYFDTVAVAADGRSFGWNLDEVGHEIDFCPDATRIRIETAIVEQLAANHAAKRSAAE
jgi:hypothetical protein